MRPVAVIILTLIGVLEALHCDKEFNYYDSYGHGFDVTCQGITKEYLHLLENITIRNEISLKIGNSTLKNVMSKIFQNVQHIRYLVIENSTFSFPKATSVFEKLSQLEHLVIKNTYLDITNYTFGGLTRLQELTLVNNNLEEVSPGSFSILKRLKVLKMTDNNIDDIGDIPMCELKNLRTLNLARNKIFSLNGNIFLCHNSNNGVTLKLNESHVNITNSDYQVLADYSLELNHFDLSFNKIKQLGQSLNHLKFIKILNLKGNKLTQIRNNDFKLLQDLEELYLSNNLLEFVDDDVFANKENLEILDLSNNNLSSLNLNNTPMLKYLNLANNEFSLTILDNITKSKSLETLLLNGNKLRDIPKDTFDKFHSLLTLDLSGNNIRLYNHSFSGLMQLVKLCIKNSSITYLPEKVFKDLSNLKELDLSQNNLTFLEGNDTFDSLENLEILNISYNALDNLNYALLKNLNNLHVLDMAGNKMKFIQYDLIMSNLPFLSVLNIKSNLLSCEFLYKIITFLKTKHVSYTAVEKFDYERENVAGIYCVSEKYVANKLRDSGETNTLIDFSIFSMTCFLLLITTVILFKAYVYLKRRRYKADEFELIED